MRFWKEQDRTMITVEAERAGFFRGLFQFCDAGAIEFRFLPSRERFFWSLEKLPELPPFPQDQDVYFAVCTRNGGGTKEHIVEIPALWVDVDFKSTDRKQTDELLRACPSRPSAQVISGGGYHLYWFLNEPAGKAEIPVVEEILRRLAKYFQADMAATDASRILRVPGTFNIKYSPPRKVKVLRLHESPQYDLTDFDEWLPEEPKTNSSTGKERGTAEARNPLGWQDDLLPGVAEGNRHGTAVRLAARWAKKGLSAVEIARMIVSWNAHNSPPKEGLSSTDQKELKDIIAWVREKHEGSQADDPLKFPDKVIAGVAGRFAEVYSSRMEPPAHFFHMAFLTCLGAVLGNRLTVTSEIQPQPRLYTVLLGESADDRKSTVIAKSVNFFREALKDFSTCHGVGSEVGLQKKIKETNSLLLVYDEFKQFVSKAKIENSALLPCVNTLFESNRYENRTKSADLAIEDAYLSLLAASTVQTYETLWTASFIDIGFTNRLFLVPGSGFRRFSIPMKVREDEKNGLKRDLGHMLRHVSEHPELEVSEKAKEIYHAWYLNREKSVHSKRLDTYALRFMSLLAVNELRPVVDEEIVNKVIALMDWQYQVRQQHDPVDAENTVARMEEKVRRALKRGDATERELKQRVNANRTGLWIFQTALTNLRRGREIVWEKTSKRWKLG